MIPLPDREELRAVERYTLVYYTNEGYHGYTKQADHGTHGQGNGKGPEPPAASQTKHILPQGTRNKPSQHGFSSCQSCSTSW